MGIHGTPQPRTIGTSASHGCIRMRIYDAEDLFDRVVVGTQVENFDSRSINIEAGGSDRLHRDGGLL